MSAAEQRDARAIIDALGLAPHPEGGHFRETFRDPATDASGRARSTAIYYLLAAGEVSRWHRVLDAAEIWHFHAGAPLELRVSEGRAVNAHVLGVEISSGQQPQAVVPTGWWQSARSLGSWTLVSCTVAPGFVFEALEMAPEGWEPGI